MKPKDFTLQVVKTGQMDAEKAASTIYCLLHDDGHRNLKLHCTSNVKGQPGDEWVEASALFGLGFYYWGLEYKGGQIIECFYCSSPNGILYEKNGVEDSVFDHVAMQDRTALTALVAPPKEATVKDDSQSTERKKNKNLIKETSSVPFSKRIKKGR